LQAKVGCDCDGEIHPACTGRTAPVLYEGFQRGDGRASRRLCITPRGGSPKQPCEAIVTTKIPGACIIGAVGNIDSFESFDTKKKESRHESQTHRIAQLDIIESPSLTSVTFLDFPLVTDLDALDADIAILGIPFGMPYDASAMANDQSRAPDAIRQFLSMWDIAYSRHHFDFDLGGPLLDGRDIKVADCGNVTADRYDHKQHFLRAEQAARKIFKHGATLITLGGDHGVPIPVMRALEVFDQKVTLVQVDAHLDCTRGRGCDRLWRKADRCL